MSAIPKSFLVQCIVISLYLQKVNASYQSYTAAVVEYHKEDNSNKTLKSVDEKLVDNAINHINLLKEIKEDLEIIVYPEKSLIPNDDIPLVSTIVPKVQDEIICNSSSKVYKDYLKLFSCAAIDYNTSIAINIIEKENDINESIYYNTVLVFNEKGFVSGRYRKWNLFGEFPLAVPKEMDVTVVQTKNNISFGIFTCFDINFNFPSTNLTRDLDVKNFIFPNNWISELPYLTALQVQQMWSHENDVVLLAAGGNNPAKGASGSGIFLGKKGPIESVFIGGKGGTKVIVQNISNSATSNEDVDKLAKDLDDFFLLRDLSMDDHTSILLKENDTRATEEVCNNDLCCQFDISINMNKTGIIGQRYKYHLVAFSGIRSFSGLRNAGIETCALIACLNDSLSSCGLRFPDYSKIVWPITFDRITIQGSFKKDGNRAQYPNSLLSSFRPISPQYTLWEKEENINYIIRKHTLNKSENRLLTFGIFGRNFNDDGPLIRPLNHGNVGQVESVLIIFTLIVVVWSW